MKAGKKIVYAALIANLAIAVIKFAASSWTGSSAMLSEAIHSSVDTGNQGLLLYGRRRASRPADEGHPFGYGMELFFWGFVVALLIFSFGGALSIYEGILKLSDPEPLSDPWINFAVLGAAALFEGYSFSLAWREISRTYPDRSTYSAVRASKDPSIFVILMEDAAALTGLAIAAAGLVLAFWLHEPIFDGIASIAIGILLLATAVLLARETRSLLTGESASRRLLERVRKLLRDDPRIEAVKEVLSMQIGADAILLAATLRFRGSVSAQEVERGQRELAAQIESAFPEVRRAFLRSSTI
jgi:cation diffusion facilitator family transporter